MFSPIGNALGVSLPPIFVLLHEEDNSIHGMPSFMAAQLIAAFLATIWAYFVLQDYPPTPPSHTTQERQALHIHTALSAQETESSSPSFLSTMQEVWKEVYTCLKDPNYRVVLWCFGLGLGFFNALLTILSQILSPCGYSEDDSGILGAIFLGSGLVGAILAGIALDLSHQYRPLLKGGYLLALIAVFLFSWTLKPHNFNGLAGSFAFLGAVMLPLLPISIETSVEATYPVNEIYSSGILLTAGNLCGIPIVFIYTALVEGYEGSCEKFAKPATIFVLVLVVICTLPILLYKGAYLRLEAEKQAGTATGSAAAAAGGEEGGVEVDKI